MGNRKLHVKKSLFTLPGATKSTQWYIQTVQEIPPVVYNPHFQIEASTGILSGDNTTSNTTNKPAVCISLIHIALRILLLISIVLLVSCKRSPVETVAVPRLSLLIEEMGCTEAWVRVKSENYIVLKEAKFFINGQQMLPFSLKSPDTLLYLENLQVKKQYSFLLTGSYINEYGREIQVAGTGQQGETMDTTGNNFSWEFHEFGDRNSDFTNSVIIDKNDIWVTGNLRDPDSLNTIYGGTCSGVHWNGREWSYLHPYYFYTCNSDLQGPSPSYAIWANPNGEIWMNGSYETARIKQGKVYGHDCVPDGRMRNMWGTGTNAIYAVGAFGSAYFFGGNRWELIKSETSLPVSDVWGYKRKKDNVTIAFMSFSDAFQNSEEKIIRIEHSRIDTINWTPGKDIFSIWMEDEKKIYTAGGGVFCLTQKGWREEKGLPYVYTNKIRGTAKNNIWVCGHFGLISHFNGVRWVTLGDFSRSGILWNGIGVKDNVAVIVGYSSATTKAVLLIVEIN